MLEMCVCKYGQFLAFLPASCPFLHTRTRSVCRNGHVNARNGRFVSGFAHAVDRCVQIRTRSIPDGCLDGRFCTRCGGPGPIEHLSGTLSASCLGSLHRFLDQRSLRKLACHVRPTQSNRLSTRQNGVSLVASRLEEWLRSIT